MNVNKKNAKCFFFFFFFFCDLTLCTICSYYQTEVGERNELNLMQGNFIKKQRAVLLKKKTEDLDSVLVR